MKKLDFHIGELLFRHFNGETSSWEEDKLHRWLESAAENQELYRDLSDKRYLQEQLRIYNASDPYKGLEKFQARRLEASTEAEQVTAPVLGKRSFLRGKWSGAAAAILWLVSGYLTYTLYSSNKKTLQTGPVPAQTVAAHTVTLQLGDGTVVTLDTAGNQMISQNGETIRREGNSLVYDEKGRQATTQYNTLHTSPGMQFRIQLPDGSKVWLNASSSLTYPMAFGTKERRVTIDGEAFFEVAQDASRPFKVQINDHAEITVLGTSFDVDAYQDDGDYRATLVSGSIRATAGPAAAQSVLLKPGEQVHIGGDNGLKVATDVNINQITAWKDGLFDFDNADIQTVMHQLSKWYGLTVEYEGEIPDIQFEGKISRSVSLDGVLVMLQRARVHFRMESDKRLVVLP